MKNHDLEDFKLPFNSEENLNAIKSHIKFNNQKKDEYIAELLLEKQEIKKQHKRTIISLVIMFLITLFGSNAITHFWGKSQFLDRLSSEYIILEYLDDNFDTYYDYSLSKKTIGQKYDFSIYAGKKNNKMMYVGYLTSTFQITDYEIVIEVTDSKNTIYVKKEKNKKYTIGNILLDDLKEGEKLFIKIYEDDNVFGYGYITI